MSERELNDLLGPLAATEKLLVALDFDGTLAPLIDEPMKARALPASQDAVADLAALPDTFVAFVSGRMLADLRVIGEHDDESPVYLAGSHGAEFWYPASTATPQREERTSAGEEDAEVGRVLSPSRTPRTEQAAEQGAEPDDVDADAVRAVADTIVADIEGAWIEHKALGFALHTRLSTAEDAARATHEIDALVVERAPGWRRRTGQDILEFSSSHAGKDAAIAALREQTGATAVFFAGDDVTDEDAIAHLTEGDLGVRVGPGETSARVRVADAQELAGVLWTLARMRAAQQE
ncbi:MULTISPECIES: trehalose-phosphatase [unclassified Microbacterium]|uniref:trehalose-phosphatase n=1 Tax=unclassified Microbacterium TaxID=2609290 RepID=UPI000C2C32A8|nr:MULTISPECIES: trehalose-phosphatase [unclassified Microbacterium]